MIRPLRDAGGVFHEEPDELASVLESRGLKLIELGRAGSPIGVLPFLEEEAIARLRHAVGPLGESEAEWKREGWEWWRTRWVQEAHYFIRHAEQGPIDATVAYSAAEVLIRAGELRGAIEDGKAEKAAALAMLVASWVFTGGVSVRLALAEPVASKYKKAQSRKAKKKRFAVKLDSGGMRKSDFVALALKAAEQADCSTPELWPHLYAVLEDAGLHPVESGAKNERCIDADGELSFTFKGVQTMLRELRGAPAQRGRPRKKPA